MDEGLTNLVPTWIFVSTQCILAINFIGYVLGNQFLAKTLFKQDSDFKISAFLGTISLLSFGLLLYVGCNANGIGHESETPGMDLYLIFLNKLPEIFLGLGIFQGLMIGFNLLSYCFTDETRTSGSSRTSGTNAMELQPV